MDHAVTYTGSTASGPKPRRLRMSRDEKARATRDSLLNAGCAVVASDGYAAATIAKIADLAGVAHGTFYNYFEDRQALFDELLPFEGLRMRDHVEQTARLSAPGVQREIARFEAFLNYVIDHDGFYRILYEAEIFAPDAFRAHMGNIINGYRGTFLRLMGAGKMRDLDPRQVDCLIHQILGIRAYAAMQINLAAEQAEKQAVRNSSVGIYRLMMGSGLMPGLIECTG